MLTQIHGGKHRPLGYCSLHLDVVARGSFLYTISSSLRTINRKVADIVLDHALTIYVPHAVQELLSQAKTRHVSMMRLTKYEVALLTPPNITIKRCTVLNPATLLPETNQLDQEMSNNIIDHDCLELIKTETKELDNVTEIPIPNADVEFFS